MISIYKLFFALAFITFFSCSKSLDPILLEKGLSIEEMAEVEQLLEKLYQSFSYEEGKEPDWSLMRSAFLKNGQFVLEASSDQAPLPQSIDDFILSWQQVIHKSSKKSVKTSEEILQSNVRKIGNFIHVDVVFRAKKSTDLVPRKKGLDSLILAKEGDDWKILLFAVHHESKL